MSPTTVALAILLLGVLALVGIAVRAYSKTAQKLFLPVSLIAGFIALIVGPQVLGRLGGWLGWDGLTEGGLFGAEVMSVWSEIPGLLISVVFAALFLGSAIPSPKRAVTLLGPQLSLGFTFASGQYVIGMLLAVLILVPLFNVSPMFGALIEIGFEGGHGTAAGMAPVMTELGFEEGGDLALVMATVGILSGVIVGVIAVNWAARRGHSETLDVKSNQDPEIAQGFYHRDQPSGGAQTVRSESLDTLTLHIGIIAVAIIIGQGILSGLQAVEQWLWADSIEIFAYVPLFPLAMLGGVIIQLVADKTGLANLIDRGTMERIQGLALDTLIIAALATLSLDAIANNIGPFAILAIAGIAWNVFVLFFLAPRFIQSYWFERGIADFGQSMGVTATGLLLLRMADPKQESPAYEAFGYKQLAFEPFFGGGLVTAASIPLIVQLGPYPLLIVMAVVLVGSILTGLFYFGKRDTFVVKSMR
ncbi:sodium/glutamate symporter [Enteractinococcus fodinae]|uniref:ESS family glutamate:Na+ symporter n=1 Tax=Enteractinococcus fodinae TaxID=684663 RepID=A0ABU2B0I8_9MICC|nr:sodium:glutamate symporter [Enteractinococcus fodinae]MDR7346519.1 ESS family glutamate:Na+ symporter [Enteractinococcus fodinae]